jgi:hypothetical protein
VERTGSPIGRRGANEQQFDSHDARVCGAAAEAKEEEEEKKRSEEEEKIWQLGACEVVQVSKLICQLCSVFSNTVAFPMYADVLRVVSGVKNHCRGSGRPLVLFIDQHSRLLMVMCPAAEGV